MLMVYNPRLGTREKSESNPSVASGWILETEIYILKISVVEHSGTPEAESGGLWILGYLRVYIARLRSFKKTKAKQQNPHYCWVNLYLLDTDSVSYELQFHACLIFNLGRVAFLGFGSVAAMPYFLKVVMASLRGFRRREVFCVGLMVWNENMPRLS